MYSFRKYEFAKWLEPGEEVSFELPVNTSNGKIIVYSQQWLNAPEHVIEYQKETPLYKAAVFDGVRARPRPIAIGIFDPTKFELPPTERIVWENTKDVTLKLWHEDSEFTHVNRIITSCERKRRGWWNVGLKVGTNFHRRKGFFLITIVYPSLYPIIERKIPLKALQKKFDNIWNHPVSEYVETGGYPIHIKLDGTQMTLNLRGDFTRLYGLSQTGYSSTIEVLETANKIIGYIPFPGVDKLSLNDINSRKVTFTATFDKHPKYDSNPELYNYNVPVVEIRIDFETEGPTELTGWSFGVWYAGEYKAIPSDLTEFYIIAKLYLLPTIQTKIKIVINGYGIEDLIRINTVDDTGTPIHYDVNPYGGMESTIKETVDKIDPKIMRYIYRLFVGPYYLHHWAYEEESDSIIIQYFSDAKIIDNPDGTQYIQRLPENEEPVVKQLLINKNRRSTEIAKPSSNLQKIKNIVVLMMENRSFDQMLGYLSLPNQPVSHDRPTSYDVDGLTGKPDQCNIFKRVEREDGPYYYPTLMRHGIAGDVYWSHTAIPWSPYHGFADVDAQTSQYEGIPMGGFVSNYYKRLEKEEKGYQLNPKYLGLVMSYYDKNDVPTFDYIAKNFAICDKWFCSFPGGTWPNRFILQTGDINHKLNGEDEKDNSDIGTFSPIETDTTIYDILTDYGVDWKVFEHGYSFIRLYKKYTFDIDNVVEYNDPQKGFESQAKAGKLPPVSFIEPDYVEYPPGVDDHAPADIANGQKFIGKLIKTLMSSPQWNDTLLIITYDEHGGFYDHVQPPTNNVESIGNEAKYGPRVPALIVSPWVPASHVSHDVFDHTSIPATILRRFCFSNGRIPFMSKRVSKANDLGKLLTLKEYRTNIPRYIPQDVVSGERVVEGIPDPTSADEHDLIRLARYFF